MAGMASADDSAEILNLLQTGILEVEGLLPWSSNYTFLVQICSQAAADDKTKIEAVYKPRRGERPLWDFSQGTLCQRERAAFLTSQALGWNLVPPTVLREGPHGLGSVQLFITHDPDSHYLTFEGEPAYRAQLQRIVLFDIIVNNADRKSGHVLLEESGNSDGSNRLWTIDHGICFHVEPKLRTVIWEFAGEPIPDDLLQTLRDFEEQLNTNEEGLLTGLASLLTRSEIAAMQKRAQRLVQNGRFNQPGSGRHYPWPPI